MRLLEQLLHLVFCTGGFAGAHLRVARGACSDRSVTMSALTQEGVELRAMGSYLGSCSGCSINDQVDIPQQRLFLARCVGLAREAFAIVCKILLIAMPTRLPG